MSEIITKKPKISKKGFVNYLTNNFSENYKEIYNYITTNTKELNLKKDDKEILSIILNSIKKKIDGEKFNKNDYLLKEQELNELKSKNSEDLVRYLVYRYRYNIYPEIKKTTEYPPNLQIEITSMCNLRCIMCYQHDKSFSSKKNGHMGIMNFDLFKKIIDEIEGNLEAVTFASRGEPTLNPELEKFLKYCENKFLGLKINTNATMFNEKIINTLLSSDLETLVLSIDAADKEMYEKIRINSNFDKIIKNLELFRKIKENNYKKSKLKVRISGVLINDKQNLTDIKKFYEKFADEFAFVNYNPWESSYENEINNISTPCSDLWRRMFVWWDGKVNPCDYDYKSTLSVWNAKDLSIKDIWTSVEYEELRDKHLNNRRKEIEPCKRCIVN